MSTIYGTGGSAYAPPGRVSFDWIGEAFGWFKANAGTWILAVLVSVFLPLIVFFVLAAAMGVLSDFRDMGSGTPPSLPVGFQIIINVFSLFYTPFIYGGVYHMAVKQLRGEQVSVGDIFSGGPYMWKMLGFILLIYLASFILAIPVAIIFPAFALTAIHGGSPSGAIGGMVGGIVVLMLVYLVVAIVLYGLLLPVLAMIADGQGVFNSIGRSVNAMKRDWGTAAGLVFVMGLLMIVSALPCYLGLLVTQPMFWTLSALAYRDMVGMRQPMPPDYGYGGDAPSGVWPPPPSV